MNSQLKRSLQDVIPNFQGQVPPEVLTCGESLYQLSLQKQPVLPKRCEIARYHICAFLAAEKYQNLGLPEPQANMPIQPKLASKLIADFRELLYQIRSATSTPQSSPRKPAKSRSVFSTPLSSPRKSQLSPTKSTPKTSSPLKRLQQLRDEPDLNKTPLKKARPSSDDGFRDVESPFNPKKVSESRSASPSKSPTVYKYDRKHVTIEDFISFANNFYIPDTITPRMIETFLIHKHKFAKKSEWLLACGMINSVYTRVNHRILTSKMGERQKLTNQLFQYQKGGLMKWNMQVWCDIVDDWIKDEPWVLDIERKYVYKNQTQEESAVARETEYRNGPGWELLERFGSMIHGDVCYESGSQRTYYETWSNAVLAELEK